MIEKLDIVEATDNIFDRNGFLVNVPSGAFVINKINEIIDCVNGILDYAPLEMAMKAEKTDRMIGCETLDIPESYKELHKAVESANVKLAGKYDIAVDALLRIKQQKMRLIENEERVGLLLDVFNIAEQAIEKIKEE